MKFLVLTGTLILSQGVQAYTGIKKLFDHREVSALESRMNRQGFKVLQVKDLRVQDGMPSRLATKLYEVGFYKDDNRARRTFRVEVSESPRYNHVWITEK